MLVSNISQQYAQTNMAYLHPDDSKEFKSNYVKISSDQHEIVLLKDIDVTLRKQHIGLASIHRRYLNVAFEEPVKCENYYFDCADIIVSSVKCNIDILGSKKAITINIESIQKEILNTISGHLLHVGQPFIIKFNESLVKLLISGMTFVNPIVDVNDSYGLITMKTEFNINKSENPLVKIIGDTTKSNPIFKTPNLDPVGLGIGGLNKEFVDIVRRTLFTRVFPRAIIDKLGILHVKGIILYGPPGTGKTLMARTIARMLNCHEPKIVSGPELFNKYVGETESNIRKLFADAEKEYEMRQDESDLHIIVIDEIDALCGKRGSNNDGTRVGDNAVDQLLAKIDGVTGLNNVLLIGMTNRIDMIDTAILRPGRFEIHIEVGLPDEEGRYQIFKIHTNKMASTNCLDDSVKLTELAKHTKNFTGAEIAGLVKNASSFALMEKFNFQNFQQIDNVSDIIVKKEHFERALLESTPMFGIDNDELPMFIPKNIIPYNEDYVRIQHEFETYFKQILGSEIKNTLSILLNGTHGCGKTAMVVNMAMQAGFPYVKIITPSNMVKYSTEQQKYAHIISIFEDAYRSSSSIVILDDIEGLLDYVPIGPRFSNTILQLLKTLIKKYTKNKLIVIGTCSNIEIMKEFGLYEKFDFELNMTDISTQSDYQKVIDSLYGDSKHENNLPKESITINEILLQFEYEMHKTK